MSLNNYNLDVVSKFFDYIVKRQMIYHKRFNLNLPAPWTDDEILQKFKFCNVFRIRDRVSVHLLKYLKRIEDKNDLLFNTIIARVFNTKDYFLNNKVIPYKEFNRQEFENHLTSLVDSGIKIFSSAYTVCQVRINKDAPAIKHIQFTYVFEETVKRMPKFTEDMLNAKPEQLIPTLTQLPLIGEFLGYQILLDLAALDFWNGRITDDDFVVIGPGAIPTTSAICGSTKMKDNLECMTWLRDNQEQYLNESIERHGDGNKWVDITDKLGCKYPWLSLSDIEFSCCEFRKYNKYLSGKSGRMYRQD